jgi:uncharacterized protein YbaP (TraB family)
VGSAGRLSTALVALLTAALPAAADPAAWRIDGPSGGELVLLGSMHLLREADYPLPASVDALYEHADLVVMEIDLDDLDAAALQSELLAAALLPSGTVLRDVLDPEIYRGSERLARELGVDLAPLERLEPWLVALTLLDVGVRRLGFQAERGLEQYVLGQARRDDKEVLGLEPVSTQVAIFDGLAPAAQQELLEQTLQELDTAGTTMSEMATAWREGKLDVLAHGLLKEFESFPELYATLVTDRNTDWVGKLEALLDDRRHYLVVVGALHLVGHDSVIEMLEARGHTVTRIAPAPP